MTSQPPYGQDPYGQQATYPGNTHPGLGQGPQTSPPYPPQYPAPPAPPTYPSGYPGAPSVPPQQPYQGAYPMARPMYQPMAVPMMPGAAPSAPGSGLAVTSLVCGIIGLVFAVFTFCGGFFISGPLGLIAVIMGALGRKSYTHKGQATAGLVMGIITLVLTFGLYLIVYVFISSLSTIPHYIPTVTPLY